MIDFLFSPKKLKCHFCKEPLVNKAVEDGSQVYCCSKYHTDVIVSDTTYGTCYSYMLYIDANSSLLFEVIPERIVKCIELIQPPFEFHYIVQGKARRIPYDLGIIHTFFRQNDDIIDLDFLLKKIFGLSVLT